MIQPGRVYYPLRASQGRYIEPDTVYLSVCSAEGVLEFISLIDGGVCHGWNQAAEFTDYLTGLKNKTWVITYSLDWINLLIADLLNCFTVGGYGQETHLLTLSNDNTEIYIIDCFSFFADNLVNVLRKAGLDYTGLNKKGRAVDYNTARVRAIQNLWEVYRAALRSIYRVHPSKTPGATALKTFRPTMSRYYPIKPRGGPVSRLALQSQTGGALHWNPGTYKAAFLYDINAAYPFVMTNAAYPLRVYAFAGHPPPSERWLATVRIDYQSNLKFSPLAVRLSDESIVHPTAASGLVITLNYIDLLTLAICGRVNILEWVEGVTWYARDESPLFRNWGAITERAIIENPDLKGLLKITTRALHSKFSQKGDVELIEIRRVTPRYVTEHRASIADLYILPGGRLAAKILTPKPPNFQCYYRPDFESLTLSMARLLLYSAIDQNTVYTDTDCIISTQERRDLSIGPGWGQWKQANYGTCIIAGPRMYAINERVKVAGVNPADRLELLSALHMASIGQSKIIQAVENPSLANPFMESHFRKHTITPIPYPSAVVRGGLAFITASPTRTERIKPVLKFIV